MNEGEEKTKKERERGGRGKIEEEQNKRKIFSFTNGNKFAKVRDLFHFNYFEQLRIRGTYHNSPLIRSDIHVPFYSTAGKKEYEISWVS